MQVRGGRSWLAAMAAVLGGAILRPVPAAAVDDCGTVLRREDAQRIPSPVNGRPDQALHGVPTTIFVPLAFHVVRTSAGEGGLPADRSCEALDDLDGAFLGVAIRFYLAGPIDYIDDDDFYYNIDSMEEIDALRSTNPLPGTVNVYFTENLNQGSGRFCGISSFTWSRVQGVVMENDCTAVWWNHTTFPHEVGHYFDLLHTHETARGRECVDGSNCATAGDQLCDTPADPGLGTRNVDPACVYFGVETDPCHGDRYDPDTANYMSGSRPSCRTRYTPEQSGVARATLFGRRPELVHDDLPAPFDCNGNGARDDCDIARGSSSDENVNGVPDECERRPGDFDGDGDVDADDFAGWPACATGPANGPIDPPCATFDFDVDDDVDATDFAGFQLVFTGPR